MKGFGGCYAENPGELANAIILCHLKALDQALLADPGVPNWCPIHEHGDDQGVVDLAPVHEVEASDGVAEDADPAHRGAGVVGHDLDVWHPVKLVVDEHP